MVRVKGVDIPNNKRIEIALTYIYGIGRSLSNKILADAKVDINFDKAGHKRLMAKYAGLEIIS